MPGKEKPKGMNLELYKTDVANLREINAHSGRPLVRRKASTIRSVVRKYAHLLRLQGLVEEEGCRLRLVKVDSEGEQSTVVEHLDLDL